MCLAGGERLGQPSPVLREVGLCRPESSTATQAQLIPGLQTAPSPQRLHGCSLSQPPGLRLQAGGGQGRPPASRFLLDPLLAQPSVQFS